MAGGSGAKGGGASGAQRRLSTRGWPRRGTARRPPSRPRCPRTCPAQPARSPGGRGSVSPWGHGMLSAPSHGDTALVCPIPYRHSPGVPHPMGTWLWCVPSRWAQPSCSPSPPGMWLLEPHREGSCRNLALGIPHSPMGTQPSLSPTPHGASHQRAPNGDLLLGIPPAVGHSPSTHRDMVPGAPQPTGTQLLGSPPRGGRPHSPLRA